jgi:hypothetical protein
LNNSRRRPFLSRWLLLIVAAERAEGSLAQVPAKAACVTGEVLRRNDTTLVIRLYPSRS